MSNNMGARKTAAKASDAAEETLNFVKITYSEAIKAAQDHNAKLIEFTRINTNAALDHALELSAVKSPAEFMDVTVRFAREQLAVLTEQTKELAALAQTATLKATERLKSKTFT
jgi:hypothetical protein